MNINLWFKNHPYHFWNCQHNIQDEVWQAAIINSLPALKLPFLPTDIEAALGLTLGEERFGPNHWTLSTPKQVYYLLKPVLPRVFTRILRQLYQGSEKAKPDIPWPIEPRYVDFLWEIMRQLLQAVPNQRLFIKSLWPQQFRYALVLTHDVESNVGQGFVRAVADLEENLGFRSSFNFVPEGYRIDMNLVDELRQRGFEIGIHGLKHDGKLFSSRTKFERCAVKINQYLKEFDAVGFRSPLTHRNPEWMQSLEIVYDLSFFDTDPFEPIAGGAMSIWPYFIGHFVELPYTLVQDYTLTDVLKEQSPNPWLKKAEFIRQHYGMALVNSHPDYLKAPSRFKIYSSFLETMREKDGYWHALPREVAQWWKQRSAAQYHTQVSLHEGIIQLTPQANS